MENNRIRHILIAISIFIISIFGRFIKINSDTNCFFLVFVLTSLLIKHIYKDEKFWEGYFRALKTSLFLFSCFINILSAFINVLYIRFLSMVIFGILFFICLKYILNVVFDFNSPDSILLYLSITATCIISSAKGLELSINKRLKDETMIEWKKHSLPIKILNSTIVSDKNNRYSSTRIKFSICFFNLVLLIVSNMAPLVDSDDYLTNVLTNNQSVNGAILTYLAYENLRTYRTGSDKLNEQFFISTIEFAINKTRKAFYD